MRMREVWKDIFGYEGLYRISNCGRVYSLVSNIVLKNVKSKSGYYHVTLCKNGTKKNFRINRLVALHFIPNPQNKPHVNHIDENKENNCDWNLEWCTPKENCNHGTGVQRCIANRDFSSKRKPVVQLTKTGQIVRCWESIWDVKQKLKYSASNISECCRGIRKTAHGHVWKFVNNERRMCI
jgi:hypothetical protein